MRIGVADTTFARVDMFKFVKQALANLESTDQVIRYTVPGIKDLPVACKRLFDEGCDIVIALGMPGKDEKDKVCANQASLGIQMVQVQEGKHVIEVFVHEDEAKDERGLYDIVKDRVYKHTVNAYWLLHDRRRLEAKSGKGLRQGFQDAGPLKYGEV